MTITRTPRRWPGYPTHRRIKYAGTAIISPTILREDFTTRIAAAKLAVQARNNPTYDATRGQIVVLGRDRVDVERGRAEDGTAVVNGHAGFGMVNVGLLDVRLR